MKIVLYISIGFLLVFGANGLPIRMPNFLESMLMLPPIDKSNQTCQESIDEFNEVLERMKDERDQFKSLQQQYTNSMMEMSVLIRSQLRQCTDDREQSSVCNEAQNEFQQLQNNMKKLRQTFWDAQQRHRGLAMEFGQVLAAKFRACMDEEVLPWGPGPVVIEGQEGPGPVINDQEED